MDQLLVSPEEAARRLGIGRTMLYGLLHDGSVPSVKLGRRRLVPVAGLDEFVARIGTGASA